MKLAQGAVNQNPNTLYLIDDLVSEFDSVHRSRVGGYLSRIGNQVLITGVEENALEECCKDNNARMFHVKHGQIEHRLS